MPIFVPMLLGVAEGNPSPSPDIGVHITVDQIEHLSSEKKTKEVNWCTIVTAKIMEFNFE